MLYDRAATIAAARQTVHAVMGVNAVYSHPALPGVETPLSVRFHNRMILQGNLAEQGYTDIVDGVNRVIFNKDELNEKGICLAVGGRVALTAASSAGIVLILDHQEPDNGPVNRIWVVGQL